MSQRFFFDVSDGEETLPDKFGVEASDLTEVIVEARSVIAEMADEVVKSNPDRPWTLIGRDKAGLTVARLPIERRNTH